MTAELSLRATTFAFSLDLSHTASSEHACMIVSAPLWPHWLNLFNSLQAAPAQAPLETIALPLSLESDGSCAVPPFQLRRPTF